MSGSVSTTYFDSGLLDHDEQANPAPASEEISVSTIGPLRP